MSVRTYYNILGVSRDATPEEITNAKNALAKVYHPDANMHNNIDTTAYMQEILEAYRALSNPEKRKQYDKELNGGTNRVFRTFKMEKPETESNTVSFVTYWNAASQLQEIVKRSAWLLERESRRESIPLKILKKVKKSIPMDKALYKELNDLSLQSLKQITLLKSAEISMEHWHPEAMNWVLVHWGQNPGNDYQTLFAQYDAHVNQDLSNSEKIKIRSQNKQFHHNLKKLLTYAL